MTYYLVPFRSYRSLLFHLGHCVFSHPLGGGGLRDNVRFSSWAHWKARSRRPISVNWIFSKCYSWVTTSENG